MVLTNMECYKSVEVTIIIILLKCHIQKLTKTYYRIIIIMIIINTNIVNQAA